MSRLTSSRRLTRREALRQSTLAGLAIWTTAKSIGRAAPTSPNEKLNIVGIGVGGRGAANVNGCASENIIALCDVDERRAAETFKRYPDAKRFTDFRRMLEQLDNRTDAVVIGTPDHTHAVAGVMAMKMGKHCYCEKPLTHNVFEARVMADTAAEQGVVTQMGTQIHAGDNYRRVVELVETGAIGTVEEVHVWLGADFNGPAVPAIGELEDGPKQGEPVPEGLDWDLWLGPAPWRPYHSAFVPFQWRYWWAYANGQLGDFFCHYCDLPFWALGLRRPTTVETIGPVHPERAAPWSISHHQYPAREHQGKQLPAVKLHWYSGGPYPELAVEKDVPRWGNAVLMVGSQGMLLADYGKHKLLPEEQFADFERPEPYIPKSIGHHREWIVACKNGGDPLPLCHFGYGGPLTEAALLSNVALRTGKRIEWDAENLKAVGCPEADRYLRRDYRDGWTL